MIRPTPKIRPMQPKRTKKKKSRVIPTKKVGINKVSLIISWLITILTLLLWLAQNLKY